MAQKVRLEHEGQSAESSPLAIHNDPVPLRVDAGGAVRVGPTRVTLETVLYAYKDGATPEEILDSFPTLLLADIYSVIGYYHRHKEEVETFLDQSEMEAEKLRQEIEARWPSAGLRERLLARMAEQERTKQEG